MRGNREEKYRGENKAERENETKIQVVVERAIHEGEERRRAERRRSNGEKMATEDSYTLTVNEGALLLLLSQC